MVLYANSLAEKHTKKIQYKIATNFLLANDEKISFLKQNNFEIHISLNGTPETNDIMRSASTKAVLANL
jgi:sulfatase maturation enzyme AslB (radical SAM superfamily)